MPSSPSLAVRHAHRPHTPVFIAIVSLRRAPRRGLLRRRERGAGWTCLAAILLMLGCQLARADGDALHGGRLVLEAAQRSTRPAADPIDAVTLDASLRVSVRGLLADVTLVQRFRNTTGDWRDARYLFPMADDAMLRGLTVTVADRVIRGTVMEKVAARKTFRTAQHAGQVASVVSTERPNLFTTRIANIAPGDTLEVTLELLLPIALADDRLHLALPTTLTPRYVNAQTPRPGDVQGTIVQPGITAGPQVSLTLDFEDAAHLPAVSSASHRLTRSERGITLRSAADRDILLEWPLADAGGLFTGTHADTRYVQLLLTPPAPDEADSTGESAARELLLVLDRSGSMAGGPIEAARAAIESALDRLGPQDAFNIVAFDDRIDPLFDASRAATPANVQQARHWVRRVDAEGGTEIAPAFDFALRHSRADRHTQIVFVTDGSIGYEDALLGQIATRLDGRRLFTVGIGSAPNRWFLERAATIGRGEALFIVDTASVERSIVTLLDTLRTPVLTDLVVGVDGGSAMFYPDPMPDLYAGRPVMVVAQLQGDVHAIVAHGLEGESRWTQRWALPPFTASTAIEPSDRSASPAQQAREPARSSSASTDGLATWWTARRIAHLEDEQRVAANPERHRDEITALALEAGIASAYTSFVAVADTIVRPAGTNTRPSEVANLMPAGATMQSIAMPQGGLGLAALTRLSLAALSCGLLLLGIARRLGPSA